LWIAQKDKIALGREINEFQSAGLDIQYCEDLKSYKKIIPTLKASQDAFVVTADDDLYYWDTWLEELVSAYKGNNREVICHRAHVIRLDESGLPLPYNEWCHDIENGDAAPLCFPTSGAGALYPPHIFHADVINAEIFMRISPQADDVWLYWMVRLAGGGARKIGEKKFFYSWPHAQRMALWRHNILAGGNDLQIQSILKHYGFPVDSNYKK
jgi:hypothetical protein